MKQKGLLKLCALLISLLMLIGLASGCQREEQAEQKLTDQPEQKLTDQPEQKQELGEKPTDYGTVKMVHGLVVTEFDESKDALVKAEIEKRLLEGKNIIADFQIESIPGSALNQRVNIMVASGEQLDAFMTGGTGGLTEFAFKGGLARPLDDLLEARGQNLLNAMPESVWSIASQYGQTLAIPIYNYAVTNGIFVREDLLDKASMEMPTNISELETALKKFKEMDVIPLVSTRDNTERHIKAMMDIPHGLFGLVEGKVIPVEFSGNYKEWLLLMRTWYQEGLIPSDYMVLKTGDANNLIAAGKAGAASAPAWAIYGVTEPDLRAMNPDASFYPMRHKMSSTPGIGATITIPASSKKAGAVVDYFDLMYSSPENQMLFDFGRDGYEYTLNKENMTFAFIENNYSRKFGMSVFINNRLHLNGYLEDYSQQPVEKQRTPKMWNYSMFEVWNTPQTEMVMTFQDLFRQNIDTRDWTEYSNYKMVEVSTVVDRFILGEADMSDVDTALEKLKEKWSEFEEKFQIAYDRTK